MPDRVRLLVCCVIVLAACTPDARGIPAFPGAEGPGADASGGRGGDVYHVTNLLDDHDGTIAGSLRYGLKTAPAAGRTIVFDVGGVINLVADEHNSTHTWLRSSAPNITIAGQTAPGPAGITIIGQGAKLSGNNWVLRHVKFRPGQDQSRPGVLTNDGITNNLQNSIIDHVSVSWADDEGLSSTDFVDNTTVQYSVIGEGINYNDHSYGSLISSEVDDAQIGYHHNLYLHNRSRNPRLGSEKGTGAVTSFTNNVIYNWYGRSGYSIDDKPSRTNFVGNYYIAGVDTRSGDDVFYSPDTDTIIYHDDTNRVDMNKNGAVDGVVFAFSGPQFNGVYQEATTPFDVPSGHVTSAANAVNQVLDYVGAMWWDRDPIDERLTNDVRNGTGATINHITDAPQDPSYTYDTEGYPQYGVTTRAAGFDADNDGMPGYWELRHGLDPNTADNNGDFDNDGYTNLEDYLNEIGAFPAPVAIAWQGGDGRFAESQNWGISQTIPVGTITNWQPSGMDWTNIRNGDVVVDAPGQHAGDIILGGGGPGSPTLSITDGWLKVEDAPHGLGHGRIEVGANSAGTLNLSGGLLRVETLSKGATGVVNFTGGVLAADSVGFDLTNNGGTIAPGDPLGDAFGAATLEDELGVMQVHGDLTLNQGVLAIDLMSPVDRDFLDIDGQFTLGGALIVSTLGDYSPVSGSWYIARADSFSGEFDFISPGYSVGEDSGGLYLQLAPTAPGDFNTDGKVDAQDYAVWREGYAQGHYTADAFFLWRDNYGYDASHDGLGGSFTPDATTQTPSPASATLLVLLAIVGVRRRVRGATAY